MYKIKRVAGPLRRPIAFTTVLARVDRIMQEVENDDPAEFLKTVREFVCTPRRKNGRVVKVKFQLEDGEDGQEVTPAGFDVWGPPRVGQYLKARAKQRREAEFQAAPFLIAA